MSSLEANALDTFLRRVESTGPLHDHERRALLALPIQTTQIKRSQDIVRAGDRPTRCCIILDGIACAVKLTGNGNRQITSLYFPGDVPDLQSLHLRVLDTSIGTLTACTVAFVRHKDLHDICATDYAVASALWRMALIDGSVFREWTTNVGQRQAYGRVAHLLCEVAVRLRAIGLGRYNAFDFPLTQGEIGDAVGLSTVHVNRILQQLRGENLSEWRGASLEILDWDGLTKAGDFDPAYLHIRDNAAPN